MVNTLEEVQAAGAALAMSTYDLIHAFDEISYNANKLSLMRGGVSKEDACKLVDLESQSQVYVRTPIANEYWARRKANLENNESYANGIKLNLSTPEEPCHFTPGGGVPQGDKLSCLYWTIFEDICLAALRIDGTNRAKLYIRGSDNIIHVAHDIC